MKKCRVLLVAVCFIFVCLSVCSCGEKDYFLREQSFVYVKQDDDTQICYWNAEERKSEILGEGAVSTAISADKTKVFFGQNTNDQSANSPYYCEIDLYFADVTDKTEINLVEKRVIDFEITPDGRYVLYVTHDEKLVLLDMETGKKDYLVSDSGDVFMAYNLSEDGSVVWGLTSFGEEYDIYVKAPGEEKTLVYENSEEYIYISKDHSVISGNGIDGTEYLYEKGKGTSTQVNQKTEAVDEYEEEITYVVGINGYNYEKEITENEERIYFLDDNDILYYYMNGKKIKIDDNVIYFNYYPSTGELGHSFYYDLYDYDF